MEVRDELLELRKENHDLKEQLEQYIPRRRIRRVYKLLKGILEADIKDDRKKYIDQLTEFIQKIEKEGPQEAGQEIKTAIENLIGIIDLNVFDYIGEQPDSYDQIVYADGQEIFRIINGQKYVPIKEEQ